MPSVCTVHFCGIVELCWHSLQACQHNEHGISYSPDAHNDIRGIHPINIIRPGWHVLLRHTEVHQRPVDPTAFCIEHPAPDKNCSYERNNVGHIKKTAKEHLPSEIRVVHQDCNTERHENAYGQRKQSELDRDPE